MSPRRAKDREPAGLAPLDPASLGRLSDEDLMRRCQLGEAESFDQLFARYEAPTLALLLRLVGERGAAEALLQEAFLRIYREADSYEHPRKFSTWFFTIVRNLAKNELRYRQRHPARSLDEPVAPSAGASPAPSGADELRAPGRTPLSGIVSKEVMSRLHKAIQELPEPEREALILHRFGNLKYREIADVLGARLGTVRSRLHSALNRLRQALGEQEGKRG